MKEFENLESLYAQCRWTNCLDHYDWNKSIRFIARVYNIEISWLFIESKYSNYESSNLRFWTLKKTSTHSTLCLKLRVSRPSGIRSDRWVRSRKNVLMQFLAAVRWRHRGFYQVRPHPQCVLLLYSSVPTVTASDVHFCARWHSRSERLFHAREPRRSQPRSAPGS